MYRQRKRIGALLAFRVGIVTLLLGALIFFDLHWPEQNTTIPPALYAFVAAVYALTIVYAWWWRHTADGNNAQVFVFLQLVGDALLVSILLLLTGGFFSLFFPLHYLVILGSTLLLERQRVLSLLLLCAVLYLGVIGMHYLPDAALRPGLVPLAGTAAARLAPTIFFRLVSLCLFAFVLRLLAREHLRVRQALRQTETSLFTIRQINDSIIRSIESGILTTDNDLRITSLNRAGERLLGRRPAEISLTTATAIIPELDPEVQDPESRRREAVYPHPDGRRLTIGYSVSPLQDESGDRHGLIFVFQDLTAFREIEYRLRLADRLAALGRLSAGLAHEIRNPLAAIRGSVETLYGELNDDDPLNRRLMEIVMREADRLNRLVDDFLTFARQDNDSAPGVFDLHDLLRELSLLFRGRYPEIEFIEAFGSDPLPTAGSGDQARQIFWNLCRNAVEALDGPGTVVITTAEYRDTATHRTFREATITDNGPGIPPELAERVFEPFFTTREAGTGLGLFIVFQLVKLNGGRISVTPAETGHGTRVSVRLPAGDGNRDSGGGRNGTGERL
ncbi:MAG: PAS domain-containing protein [Deltaproteobacteria bacterium]|nr:PAS domain-containing protein [Candidatus Anaeroferrophillacea bacterium]